MTQVEQSGFDELIEQEYRNYVYPENVINIVQIEDTEEKITAYRLLMEKVHSEDIFFDPNTSTLMFFVFGSDPDIAQIIKEEKGLDLNNPYVSQSLEGERNSLVAQGEQLLQKQQNEQTLTETEQQHIMSLPYLRNAFTV